MDPLSSGGAPTAPTCPLRSAGTGIFRRRIQPIAEILSTHDINLDGS
jgi:hypothetical protein